MYIHGHFYNQRNERIEVHILTQGDRTREVVIGADGASVVGETTIVGIEAFRKPADVARQGDTVGLMLRGISREQVHAGDTVVVRQ